MTHKKLLLTALIFLSCCYVVSGQKNGINRDGYRIHVFETNEVITIDGLLNEKAWITAEHTGRFTRVFPVDSGYAYAQTEALL